MQIKVYSVTHLYVVVVLPQFATKEPAVSHSFTLPRGMGRRIRRQKGKNSCVGMRTVYQNGKGRRKQQLIILIKKHIQHAVFSSPNAQLAPE